MKRRWIVSLVAGLGLIVPAVAVAFGAQASDTLLVPKGETKTGTYYAAGQTVTIDGDIDGDLICAGSNVAVNGAVHGDVLCAGQIVTVSGPVDGSVRLAGQTVTVNAPVGRNATIVAQGFILSTGGNVLGDLGVLAQTVSVNGVVGEEVYGAVQSLTIGGTVGGVEARVRNLALSSGAKVDGNVRYTSEQTFVLDQNQVSGEIHHSAPPVIDRHNDLDSPRAELMWRLYWLATALVMGLAVVWLAPRLVRKVTRTMRERAGGSLGWGLVAMLLGPLVALALVVTLVGLPLGVMALVGWGLVLALNSVFVGVLVGRWLLYKADWHKESLTLAAAFGIPLTVILFNLPLVGGLIMLAASAWAVGGVVLSAKSLRVYPGDGR